MAEELSRILSGDPLPRVPVEDDPDIDKWRRDVVSYLRRLTGKLTNQVISDAAGDPDLLFEHVDDTFVTHTGDTVETTLKTVSIPANTIVDNTMIICEAWGRGTTVGSSTNFTIRFKYNGTLFAESITVGAVGLLVMNNTSGAWHGSAALRWDGSTTAQRGVSQFDASGTSGKLQSFGLTENVAIDRDFTLTLQYQTSSQGNVVGVDFLHLKAVALGT